MGNRNDAQHDLREAPRAEDVGMGDADAACRIAGMLVVTLFPALFWMSLLATVGAAIGHMPSALVLATFASAIAAFLAPNGSIALRK